MPVPLCLKPLYAPEARTTRRRPCSRATVRGPMQETKEDGMKVVHCECGADVRAESEEELIAGVEQHVGEKHPELVGQMSREQIIEMAEEE